MSARRGMLSLEGTRRFQSDRSKTLAERLMRISPRERRLRLVNTTTKGKVSNAESPHQPVGVLMQEGMIVPVALPWD